MKLRTDGLSWREMDGEAVLLDLKASTYLRTNRSGTLLLRLLVDERGRPELVAALQAEYGISAADAERDTDEFLELLQTRGLLVGEAN